MPVMYTSTCTNSICYEKTQMFYTKLKKILSMRQCKYVVSVVARDILGSTNHLVQGRVINSQINIGAFGKYFGSYEWVYNILITYIPVGSTSYFSVLQFSDCHKMCFLLYALLWNLNVSTELTMSNNLLETESLAVKHRQFLITSKDLSWYCNMFSCYFIKVNLFGSLLLFCILINSAYVRNYNYAEMNIGPCNVRWLWK